MSSWSELIAHPCLEWKEPDPGVARLAPQWKEEGREAIYDLGCGAGRHLAYLQLEGFEVVGTDVSDKGLASCARQMWEARLPCRLVKADMTAAPFADESFDAGLATNVLNHGTRAALQEAVDDVWRVLKPGGEFYLTVLSTDDWRHGSGEEVEPDSFVLAEGPETGILHHLFSEEGLRDWLAAFEIIEVDRHRAEQKGHTRDGRCVMRDAWAVWVRRTEECGTEASECRGTEDGSGRWRG